MLSLQAKEDIFFFYLGQRKAGVAGGQYIKETASILQKAFRSGHPAGNE